MASKQYVNGEHKKAVDYSAEQERMKCKRKLDQKLLRNSQLVDKVVISTGGKSPTPLHQSKAVMPARSSVLSSPEQSTDSDFESFTSLPMVSQIEGPPLLRAKEYTRLHKLWKSAMNTKRQLGSKKEGLSNSGKKGANYKEKYVPEASPRKPSKLKHLRKAKVVTEKDPTSDIILSTPINLNKPPITKKFRLLKDIYNQE